MPSTTALDVNWTDRLRSVPALLEAGGHHVIIGQGPASTTIASFLNSLQRVSWNHSNDRN